jgi:transketolase
VGLPNLTVVAVDNQSSSYGWGPGGIEAHFAVSGWSTVRVSGRDHEALASAFRITAAGSASAGPQLVVATVEGREALCKTGHGGNHSGYLDDASI